MKFTVDLMFGWAHPGTKLVKNSPGYPRTWWVHALKRKMVAPDGYIWMYAVRLLGLTIGATVTRECVTPATPQAPVQAPFISSPPSQSGQQVHLTPEQMAQVQAIISSAATTKTTPSPAQ